VKAGVCAECDGLGIVDLEDGGPDADIVTCRKCGGRGFISSKDVQRNQAYMSRRWTGKKRRRFIELFRREMREVRR